MKTDITIIIPTYNAEHTIEKCVESLLKQVGNFSYQIIILDDGSSAVSYTHLTLPTKA